MATWKKVIVSGSDISQLNNDANYLVEGGSGASLSGSFSGSFQGDGSNLTGVVAQAANALTDGNGVADFTYDGSTSGVTVAVEADGGTLTVGADGVKVSDLGIDSAQLAPGSVTAAKIATGSVGTIQLADDAVDGAKIADGSISTAMFSGSALVTAAEGIGSNDVDTAVPTAAAVKAYADSVVGAADLDGAADDGTFTVDLDDQTFTVAGGAGIETTGSGQTVTIKVGGASVTNDMLAGSIANAKLVNDSVTLGTTEVDLGTTATTLAGLTLTGANASGSFSGSFAGDGSNLTGVSAQVEESLLLGNGLTGGTFDGSTGVTASINLDGATLAVGASGIKVADLGVDSGQLATGAVTDAKIASGSIQNNKLANDSFTVSDGSNSTGIDLGGTLTFSGTANEVDVVEGSGTVTVGLPDDVTISQDLVVSRNLTVQGTASFQHTEDLAIADRFILLASGSNAAGDGGIVVQQTAQDVGEVFAFDQANVRWGVSGSFDASQNAFTPDAFMAAVVNTAGNDPNGANAPDTRYEKKGNLYVASNSEDIWIYS
jgi:uncharacterized protein YaiE (UPF0345 family)